MKTISIINLKGGVAKTLTADNMAHVLAVFHKKRVLLVDNDKQGNTSKAFGVHSYDEKSLSDVLTARRMDVREVIKKTRFENIDVLPAIAADDAAAGEEVVVYLTGEFFADAINLPDSVTVDTLTTAFRNIGIFLK